MQDDTAALFDRASSAYDRAGPQVFASYGRRLVELAHISRGMRVLDVATGKGAILFPAARQVGPPGRVLGVDLSMGMLRATTADLRAGGGPPVELSQMDAGRLALTDASFDRVLCGHAIFFFPDAVKEFYRVLRPGGQAGITIISRGCFDWLMQALEPYQPPHSSENKKLDDLAVDTPDGLRKLLAQASFHDIQVSEETTDSIYANDDEWWSTLWTIGVRSTLERMDATTLGRFRAHLLRQMQAFHQPDGVHILFRVLFAFGVKGQ